MKPQTEDFWQAVWAVVRLCPAGRVTTYGAIARALGASSGARMVGYAMNASHNQVPEVPAHRVVNRIGQLSGKAHFNPPEKMKQLLESEGVAVYDDHVVDFEIRFWDPATELV
jgi:methylated-DNA-protein-cysteine methyltransferase-like protein